MAAASDWKMGEVLWKASYTKIIQASTKQDAWILDPFSGSATTGIAACLLGRKFLGLEIEENFLMMGRQRREEIENLSIRENYIERLAKMKAASLNNKSIVAENNNSNYGVPWL